MHYHQTQTVLMWTLALPITLAAIPRKRDVPTLEKAVIDPIFYWDSMNPSFDLIPTVEHTINLWTNDSIPIDCKTLLEEQTADGQALTVEEVEVFDVTYSDCEREWIFCRHPSAFDTKETMADQHGRIPAGLRSYIHYTVSWGGDGPEGGRAFYSTNTGNVALPGDSINQTWVWIHEAAHAYDDWYFPTNDDVAWVSETQDWFNAFSTDEAVITDYALTNQVENFAETLMAAVYELNWDGGLAEITNATPQFANMLSFFTNGLAEDLTLGGQCKLESRFVDSPVVSKTEISSDVVPIHAPQDPVVFNPPIDRFMESNEATPTSAPKPESSENVDGSAPTDNGSPVGEGAGTTREVGAAMVLLPAALLMLVMC